jgi:error-prone DNA polymerase
LEYASWDPFSDKRTLDLIRQASTIGCFNIESPAVRLLLRKLWTQMPQERKSALDSFEYLVMISSLVRPAAISFVPEFIRRAHFGNCEALHPALKDILYDTHGIILYQEDVSRVAVALAGFSPEQADQLRKALNKKRKAKELKAYRADFYRGALDRGVPLNTIDRIWQMILSFVGYSFCKAHSASYAQVSFRCAYLKAHYPAEFMAAVLSNEGGYYPALAYLSEARRMGLKVELPDINFSNWSYEAVGGKIRIGLMQIKGIKKALVERLAKERDSGGPFRSFREFWSRVHPELAQARLLIKAGCFDSVACGRSRPGMLWEAYALNREAEFKDDLPNPEEYAAEEKIAHEIASFGFVVSQHPLELYKANLPSIFITASDMKSHVGKHVRLLGWVITEKLTQTRNGEPMEFVTLEDTSGIYEAIFFPDIYRKFWRLLAPNRPFVVEGVVDDDFGALTVNVKQLSRLDMGSKSCYAGFRYVDRKRKDLGKGFSSGPTHATGSAKSGGVVPGLRAL